MEFQGITLKSRLAHFFVYAFIGLLISRGLISLFIPKQVAYIIQTIGILFLLYFFWALGSRRLILNYVFIIWILVAAISAMISGFTIIEHVIAFAPVVFFTFALFVFSYNTTLTFPLAISMLDALVFGIAGMLVIGTLQQVGVLQLDMEIDSLIGGIVRPSSITGSYLHYPLILALAFFVFNQAYTTTGAKKYLLMSMLTFLGCLISLSRSGALIIFLGLLLFSFQNIKFHFNVKVAKNLVIALCLIFFIPILLQLLIYLLDMDSDVLFFIWDRLSGGFSLESAGNTERLGNWSSAFALFLEGPILLGGAFGLLSNAGQNFGISHYGVAESGGLQILTSFGVIGFIAYYASWFKLWGQINIEHHWLRAGFIAAIVQTTVYQSTEVIPFISLLIMFPIISKSISHSSPNHQPRVMKSGYQ